VTTDIGHHEGPEEPGGPPIGVTDRYPAPTGPPGTDDGAPGEGAPGDGDRDPDAYRGSRLVNRLAMACFGAQLLGLTAFTGFIYHRFSLGIDFGIYSQALSQIAAGNLDPTSTINGFPFLHSHFELIMYPLSLVYLVFRTSYVLLVVQNVSLVGAGVVAYLWIAKLVVSRRLSTKVAVGFLAGSVLLILLDPFVYYSAALDIHLEATATFFAVFAAYDIWSGRNRRALVWVVLCLLCGDLGGLYIVGVGFSGLIASRSTRRFGAFVLLIGIAWTGLISALGANQASLVTTSYAYLAGRPVLPTGFAGLWALFTGLVAHPNRPYDILRSRARLISSYLLPGGTIGFVTPWGFGVPAAVLLASALQASTLFIDQQFQQFAVFPFVLFGTVSLLTFLVTDSSPAVLLLRLWADFRVARVAVAGVLAIAAVVGALAYAHNKLPGAPRANASGTFIPADEATTLGTVLSRTSSDTEVIASIPIMGRFGDRKYFYPYDSPTANFPTPAGKVLLVMDTTHTLQFVSAAQLAAAARYLTTALHARTVVHNHDVWALEWTPGPGQASIVLP